MQLSIFNVLGPIMIGPSSSHTAGAAKLARVAAQIAAKPFQFVHFGLSGSFAKTGAGHGTHQALLAGVLGFAEDDERIRQASHYALQKNIEAEYHEEDLEWLHENAVHITFFHTDGTQSNIWGASLGGGRILIRRIGSIDTHINAECVTFVVRHIDRPGVVSDISRILAENNINIAVMRLARVAKGSDATVIIEVDGKISADVAATIRKLPFVVEGILIDV